jgi:hypothetical protein
MNLQSTLVVSNLLLAGFASAQVIQVEPNDSFLTATPSTLVAGSSGGVISIGNNGDGPFGPTAGNSSGDFDFFSIPANTDQVIIFDVNSNIKGSGVDTVIGLYNSSGVLLASNDDDGVSRDSFIRFTAPASDTYYGVVGNWVPSAGSDADSLPTDANTAGTGRGVPGGLIADYEVVILLDGGAYLTQTQPLFRLGNPEEVIEGVFILTNEGADPVTINGSNFTGPGASAYTTSQTFPLTIPAGLIAPIELTFTPGGSTERFEAAIELTSNDIVHPTFSLRLFERAIAGLVFRVPFDDPAGSSTGAFGVPAELSGNFLLTALIVNAGAPQPIFGRPPLAGTEGFSAFLNDAGSSGNYILTGNNFPHPATFTYSVWARPTAGSGEDVLFNRDGAFSNNDGIYGCSITASGAVRFRISGTEILISDDGVVPDNSAHHIVVTHLDSTGFGDFTADRTRLYLDGVMIAENTETFEVPEYSGENNSRLWIGTRSAAGAGFNGDLDEFQMYNIELSAAQVQRLFNDPTTVIENVPPVPLVITNLTRVANGSAIVFTFASTPGLTYNLESSADLINWSNQQVNIASQGALTSFAASGLNPETTELFFRIVVTE